MFKILLKGTLVLTITGLITRIIGFAYKIYLSNILGARMLGIYQLVFPVFGICFTIFGAGIQTAVSQMVASKQNNISYLKSVLAKSLFISALLSLLLSAAVYLSADYIATVILGEPQCHVPLKMLSAAFPMCAVASCINGCYYGLKETGVPAVSQLIEQIARVFFVYFSAIIIAGDDMKLMCLLAVAGIAIGEGISMIYNIIRISLYLKKNIPDEIPEKECGIMSQLIRLAAPLTGNKLIIALLHSIETILIPIMLKKHGMDSESALSVYGVLTGMAVPLIMFPSTITNSLSVLLLPTISEVSSDNSHVKRISGRCIACSLILGIASTVVFLIFGANLGSKVFNNESVGLFVEILAFLCPFMFTATTLTSIINGLGYTYYTFVITIIGLAIRILITVKAVPADGISGYLVSLLISQLVVTLLSYIAYKHLVNKKSVST